MKVYNSMRYQTIDNRLFKENRKNFTKHLKPNSIAIFTSNDQMPKSADASYKWRQNPDLFYLTGIDQEETFLILYPDAPVKKWREVLFVRETNEYIKVWEGEKLTKEEASKTSGINDVLLSSAFQAALGNMILQAETIYLNLNENDRANNVVEYGELRFAKELKAKYPLHKYERSAPILNELRAVKSKIELELTQTAVDITAKAFNRILKFTKPNVWEYEIEAEMIHEFTINRATGHAFSPIIAAGASSCILHYEPNNKQCKDGDLLLLDFGAEYGNYNADMTRTIPVNGKFSKRQKEVYNAVLRVMKFATSQMKAGIVLNDFNKSIGDVMEKELIDLKLLKLADVKKQDPEKPLYKKYFPHGTSHFLGLDVHDIGNRYGKIKAGALLTCEPGIYIPEEKIGIRLENDILVTNGKPIDLMKNVPIEAEEIEELMNKKTK